MEKQLTVIIPVYRVSDTIDRCLRSVTGQRYAYMEIILVDDGSPDNCPAICDQWAERDNRITVIHKNNGGLSDARNAGLDIAKGEYVAFVDSDDYMAEGTLEALMRIMDRHPEYDLLEFPVYKAYGSPRQSVISWGEKEYSDMAEYWMENRTYEHTYAWNKIYRRRLFDNVRFPVGMAFEDIYTLPRILENAKKVATTEKGLYYYCWNKQGITAKAGAKEWRMMLNAHLNVIYNYQGHPMFHQYYMHVVNMQLYEYELTGDKPALKFIRVWRLGGLNYKDKLKAIAINILGLKGLCKVSKALNRIARFH